MISFSDKCKLVLYLSYRNTLEITKTQRMIIWTRNKTRHLFKKCKIYNSIKLHNINIILWHKHNSIQLKMLILGIDPII